MKRVGVSTSPFGKRDFRGEKNIEPPQEVSMEDLTPEEKTVVEEMIANVEAGVLAKKSKEEQIRRDLEAFGKLPDWLRTAIEKVTKIVKDHYIWEPISLRDVAILFCSALGLADVEVSSDDDDRLYTEIKDTTEVYKLDTEYNYMVVKDNKIVCRIYLPERAKYFMERKDDSPTDKLNLMDVKIIRS